MVHNRSVQKAHILPASIPRDVFELSVRQARERWGDSLSIFFAVVIIDDNGQDYDLTVVKTLAQAEAMMDRASKQPERLAFSFHIGTGLIQEVLI